MKNFALPLKSQTKFLVIKSIIFILVGMILLGIFGFNQPIDYKDYYQVTINVDQNIDNSFDKANSAAKTYFKTNNLNYEDYSTQQNEKQTLIIYKFSFDVSDKDDELKSSIENAVNNTDRVITVKTTFVKANTNFEILPVIISLVILMAAFFIYELIVEKIKAALTNLLVSILATVEFIALIGITRIPALPYISLTIVVAYAFASVLSVVMINRFKEISIIAGNEKLSTSEIAIIGQKQSLFRFLVTVIFALIISIFFIVLGGYNTFLGLQILLLAISSGMIAYIATPVIYSALK